MSWIPDIANGMSSIPDMRTADYSIPTRHLGDTLRTARLRLGLTQAEAARRAGIARQKLIQIEQGKPGVAMAAYAAAMHALGLEPDVRPARVQLAAYPQLKRLTWNQPGVDALDERDALALYERYWDLVDADLMDERERALLERLVQWYGRGSLHV
ncbi:helix-turn-helix transcriptional regulator [Luteimonas sp. 3794]|uniref:helix-turn-helix transcriptional regulator n=1 Tax=Luteimonas sp. 3794 TaxID=2817730 RepID=UPI002856477C|nr:helix-turn-helix transcriptional regulator [Luteimonas sp. 3794]MDR6991178.1 transcriptional regulator with XRE-family HTH domain [Luteimonas sp. 3794]